MTNLIGLSGIDFVEFGSPHPQSLEALFLAFGFSKTKKHKDLAIDYFEQNDIRFFLNQEGSSQSGLFVKSHGPSISSMGWKFQDPQAAHALAVKKGARPAKGDFKTQTGESVPAIYGIGDSLIYFLGVQGAPLQDWGFVPHPQAIQQKSKGFLTIDHLTNNVEKGMMQTWAEFYKNIFGFTEVRYFDIRGARTGLTSYALRSPCGTFCIPINEGTESKSQINEYLEEYKGPGIQHLAFLTDNILESLNGLKGSAIETLDIDDEYYAEIFQKFPQVTEDHAQLRQNHVLIDGDEQGYLLQIFTKNLIGPIFIEIIQRHNHLSFGEGNFGALFRSIERDQMKRGYLST